MSSLHVPPKKLNIFGSNTFIQKAYSFLLCLCLGVLTGAAEVVVDVSPADHLVPLLRAGLVGTAGADQGRDHLEWSINKAFLNHLQSPHVGVAHGLEAVAVPAGEGEAGADEAAQEAEADQSVHACYLFN